ncbi:hypothetical protein ACFQ78_40625, partial [Streptomyces sp. NPDC056519]|uniref:hypothetical protein n=1 Tax=Streptomyces sp. NPDC056519 TaxID=3345849 RepID=UPI003681A5DF
PPRTSGAGGALLCVARASSIRAGRGRTGESSDRSVSRSSSRLVRTDDKSPAACCCNGRVEHGRTSRP